MTRLQPPVPLRWMFRDMPRSVQHIYAYDPLQAPSTRSWSITTLCGQHVLANSERLPGKWDRGRKQFVYKQPLQMKLTPVDHLPRCRECVRRAERMRLL